MHNSGFYLAGKKLSVRYGLLPALVLLVLVGLFACSDRSSSADNPPVSQQETGLGFDTIAAVGDSLTAGYGVDEAQAYPVLLENRLLRDGYFFHVVNAGISGETSSGVLSRIEWVIGSLKPDIVILETGANDGLRGVDPTLIQENIDRVVTILRENGINVLLAGMRMPPNLGRDYTTRFADLYKKIADKHEIPLMPFFLKSVAGERRYILSDGIHPNAEGYRLILDDIYPYVVDVIKSEKGE
jgi:acyl-CoA thioesterase I